MAPPSRRSSPSVISASAVATSRAAAAASMSVFCSARSSRCTSVVTSSRRRFRFFSAPGGVSTLCGSARYAAKNVSWTPQPLMAPQASVSMDDARRAKGGGCGGAARGQCSRSWAVAAARRSRWRASSPGPKTDRSRSPKPEKLEAAAAGAGAAASSSTRASSFCASRTDTSAKSTVSAHVRATPGAASVPRSRPSAWRRKARAAGGHVRSRDANCTRPASAASTSTGWSARRPAVMAS